ncbi:hypothetical protein BDB01DRAFT_892988 [Pilobolus umbonatus]|nr:hypothetical protein BDB01DRAFT_892988 [Pilobolus umbonatus]
MGLCSLFRSLSAESQYCQAILSRSDKSRRLPCVLGTPSHEPIIFILTQSQHIGLTHSTGVDLTQSRVCADNHSTDYCIVESVNILIIKVANLLILTSASDISMCDYDIRRAEYRCCYLLQMTLNVPMIDHRADAIFVIHSNCYVRDLVVHGIVK